MSILDETGAYEPLDKYLAPTAAAGSSMALPEKLVYGAMATVVDIGTTYWNSLTPEKYNADTADLLLRIDQDALQVYNEHPDAVRTASFVGGILAPVGLSIKGMNMLRSGAKGMSFFSEAGQASRLAQTEAAFANAGKDAAFIKAKWDVYRGVAMNAVTDNIAAEIAIIGTMSAHPYLEDYMKNLGSNFLMGVAFGTGIQTGLGTIIAKSQIGKLTGAIEKEANVVLKDVLWDPMVEASITQRSHLGELAAVHAQGVENLKTIVADADTVNTWALKPFTIETLRNTAVREEASLVTKLKEASVGDFQKFLDTAPAEVTEQYLSFIAKVENAGLDKIGFAEVKGTTGKLAAGEAAGKLQEAPSLFKTVLRAIKGVAEPVEVAVKTDAIYLATHNRYIGKADGPLYMNVADMGKTIEGLEAEIGKNFGRAPDADWSITARGAHTAELDADYAKAVLAVEKWEPADFQKAILDPDDLPALKAIYGRAGKLLEADPTLKLSIKLTKEKPSWGAVQQAALIRKGGVSATYVDDLKRVEVEWDSYSLYNWKGTQKAGVEYESHKALMDWVKGEKEELRLGAALHKNLIPGGVTALNMKNKEAIRLRDTVSRIYNSKQSEALRAKMQTMADEDGFVWLYRGLAQEPRQHQALESYALSGKKASEFTQGYEKGVKMYKVHVDDIFAGVKDMGPGGSISKAAPEILAFPPVRDWAQIARSGLRELPDELLIQMPEVTPMVGGKSAVATTLTELEEAMKVAQLNAVTDLASKGYGLETIALKTGTPEDTIARILETKTVEGGGLLKYKSREDIIAALDSKNRSLALSTEMNKVPQPGLFAELNKRGLDNSSDSILEYYLLSSKSDIVRQFGETLLSKDLQVSQKALYDELATITGSEMKTSMLSSTNQVMEALGPVGMIANYIGKETIRIKNQLTESFEKPISGLMSSIIQKGEAHLIEANTSIAVNASIKGPRIYKDGAFWVPANNVKLQDFLSLLKLSDDEFRGALNAAEEGKEFATKALFKGQEYEIATPELRQMWEKIQDYGREMYEMKNVRYKAMGKEGLNDIGLWAPSFNPRNKSIAYVHNLVNDTTSMLYAESDELLATAIKSYEDALRSKHGANWRAHERIVTKNMQEPYNTLAGRHDSLTMQAADLTKQHGGASTPTIVSTDTSVFQDLLQGYQEHIHGGVEGIMEIKMNSTMNALKNLSDISQGMYAAESKGILSKLGSKPADVGQTVRKILLGQPLLSEHKPWSELQQRLQVGSDMVLKNITEVFQPLLTPLTTKLTGAKLRSEAEWSNILKEMDAKGIVNPFDSLDKTFGLGRYMLEGKGTAEGLTPRGVALGNATAATLMLRVGELAQPLVNALSLPILTSAAMNRKLASSFMGTAIDPEAKFALARTMHNGVRLMNHPTESVKWSKLAEERGLFNIELRNVTELLEHQRSLDPGLMTLAEKGIESKLVSLLSKPADWSESFVRRTSFFTAVDMAKRAYPGISDTGVMIFARNFMDEAIGNYTAAQRPAFFQGTFGVALGLFQTYMLTMAQAMYRQVEHKDWASLGKMLLTQGTIFGAASLPGFQIVSEQIGKSFSDNNVDLETGLIRSMPDKMADIVLYGLPSSFGPGITTRGEIQPRIPNPFAVDQLVLVNMTGQAYTAMERVASAAWNADESAGRAILEAISLQSISRPIARISELAVGRSITSRGDIVSDDIQPSNLDNFFSLSTLSRVMSTRPLEEIKAREALHMNTVYGAADRDKRRAVTARLKSHIRNGNLDSEVLDNLAERYMRTGSSVGWRAAVSDAIKQAGQSGDATTMKKLGKDNILNVMIDDLE
jgi:hypothetical protein